MTKAARSGNPAFRAAQSARRAPVVRQTQPVDYIDEPLPGVGGAPAGVRQDAPSRYAERLERLEALQGVSRDLEKLESRFRAEIARARAVGLSWADIGSTLGVDRETARRRWGGSDTK